MKITRMKQSFVDMIPKDLDVCLLGLQGSRALGMAQSEDADYDYRGVYVAKNSELLSLSDQPKETIEIGKGAKDGEAEFVFHELGKFMRLALKGNPSVLHILFVPKYNIKNDIGDEIVKNRKLFLSEKAIRNAFGGYAMSQILYLKRNSKFQNAKKREKHVRHCFRLFDSGQELLETGNITLPLKDPQKYIDLGREQDIDKLFRMFDERDKKFRTCKSSLPEKPDVYWINRLLLKFRGV